MKKVRQLTLLFALMALAGPLWAQLNTCPAQTPTCDYHSTVPVASSGTGIVVPSNGGVSANFEYLFTGSPSSCSITLQGCGYGGTCDALGSTVSSCTATNNAPTFTKPYNYFIVTPTFSGGTTPTFTVNMRNKT
jgi:hypothetical protein